MFNLDWDVLAATGRRAFYCEGCRRVGRKDNVLRFPCGYTEKVRRGATESSNGSWSAASASSGANRLSRAATSSIYPT